MLYFRSSSLSGTIADAAALTLCAKSCREQMQQVTDVCDREFLAIGFSSTAPPRRLPHNWFVRACGSRAVCANRNT
jgi:hypothetical protein